MKVKVSKIDKHALDWAVANCQGCGAEFLKYPTLYTDFHEPLWNYSSDWNEGGPLIFREKIRIIPIRNRDEWMAAIGDDSSYQYDPNPLVAAMRCYVAYKMGDEIDIPDELLK